MTELLAPAGNMEALKAAVSNGCNAGRLRTSTGCEGLRDHEHHRIRK